MKLCPTCGEYFCESSDRQLWTCFFLHVQEGKCTGELLRAPFGKLAKALASEKHRELYDFVYRDSDGLGNPLPKEACLNLGLAVAYANDALPEYNKDVLIARDISSRARRARLQKRRRSAKKLGMLATGSPAAGGPALDLQQRPMKVGAPLFAFFAKGGHDAACSKDFFFARRRVAHSRLLLP